MYAPWNVNNYLALLEDGTWTYRQADRETDRGMHYRNDAFSLPVIVHVSPEGKENYKKETRGKKQLRQSNPREECSVECQPTSLSMHAITTKQRNGHTTTAPSSSLSTDTHKKPSPPPSISFLLFLQLTLYLLML